MEKTWEKLDKATRDSYERNHMDGEAAYYIDACFICQSLRDRRNNLVLIVDVAEKERIKAEILRDGQAHLATFPGHRYAV